MSPPRRLRAARMAAMIEAGRRKDPISIRMSLTGRRLHAWWEGYDFDETLEREDAVRRARPRAGKRADPVAEVAQSIWGAGRAEPGDPAFTMRLARTLAAPAGARAVVFGAGEGALIRDLKQGARWKATGLAQTAARGRGFDVRAYDEALSRLPRAGAACALSYFELHRDADPTAFARFAAEFLRSGAPIAFLDFAIARKGARLPRCFPAPWPGAPRLAADYGRALREAGFEVIEAVDETASFLPLVSRGWANWKRAYETAARTRDQHLRFEKLRLLSSYAELWAERHDALRSGQLQAVRILAAKAR